MKYVIDLVKQYKKMILIITVIWLLLVVALFFFGGAIQNTPFQYQVF